MSTVETMLEELSRLSEDQVVLVYNPHRARGFSAHRYLTERKVSLINNPHLPMDVIQKIIDTDQIVECTIKYRRMFLFGGFGYSVENVLQRMLWLIERLDQKRRNKKISSLYYSGE